MLGHLDNVAPDLNLFSIHKILLFVVFAITFFNGHYFCCFADRNIRLL